MTWHLTPYSKCPHCGTSTPLATGAGHNNKPDPGDCTLCIACGRWGTFNDDMTLRKPTAEELASLGRNGFAIRAHLAWIAATAPKEKTP